MFSGRKLVDIPNLGEDIHGGIVSDSGNCHEDGEIIHHRDHQMGDPLFEIINKVIYGADGIQLKPDQVDIVLVESSTDGVCQFISFFVYLGILQVLQDCIDGLTFK